MKDGFLAQVNVKIFLIVSLCVTDARFVPQLHVTLFIA